MNKKKVISLLLLAALCIGLTGCGKEPSDATAPDSSQDNSISENTQETTPSELPNASDTGVYPNETELTPISMGVSENICTVTVPLDYVLVGGYYDEDGNEHSIDGLDSATTTVKEAMAAGSFSTGENIAAFTATSVDGDATMITATMYLPSIMSWDDFKATYPEAEEIGTADVPGLYYHVEAFSGKSLAVAIKVSDDITLSIVYEGSLEDQIGATALAQELYELVAVK